MARDVFIVPTSGTIEFKTDAEVDFHISASGDNLIISGAGNVGIGTRIPEEQLDIRGGTSTVGTLLLGRSHAPVIGGSFGLGRINFGGEDIDGGFSNYESAFISAIAESTWTSAADTPTRLVFYTTHDTFGNPTASMTIKGDGNVGIGTTSPGTFLGTSIAGTVLNISASDFARIAISSVGGGYLELADTNATLNEKWVQLNSITGKFRIVGLNDVGTINNEILAADLTNGNVGIGTTVPATTGLHVWNNVSASEFYGDGSNLTNLTASSLPDWVAASASLWTGDGTKVWVSDINDNVGIGTTNPLYPLHISTGSIPVIYVEDTSIDRHGSIALVEDRLAAGKHAWEFGTVSTEDDVNIVFRLDGGTKMMISSSGQVGIGTTDPSAATKLHVYGIIGTGTNDGFLIGEAGGIAEIRGIDYILKQMVMLVLERQHHFIYSMLMELHELKNYK